jgi:hypothetical protein
MKSCGLDGDGDSDSDGDDDGDGDGDDLIGDSSKYLQ